MTDMHWILQRVPVSKNQTHILLPGETTLGRGAENKIRCPSLFVSRNQCIIIVKPCGNIFLRDIGSSNGTFINCEKSLVKRDVPLMEDDVIGLGVDNVNLYNDDSAYFFKLCKPSTPINVNAERSTSTDLTIVNRNEEIIYVGPLDQAQLECNNSTVIGSKRQATTELSKCPSKLLRLSIDLPFPGVKEESVNCEKENIKSVDTMNCVKPGTSTSESSNHISMSTGIKQIKEHLCDKSKKIDCGGVIMLSDSEEEDLVSALECMENVKEIKYIGNANDICIRNKLLEESYRMNQENMPSNELDMPTSTGIGKHKFLPKQSLKNDICDVGKYKDIECTSNENFESDKLKNGECELLLENIVVKNCVVLGKSEKSSCKKFTENCFTHEAMALQSYLNEDYKTELERPVDSKNENSGSSKIEDLDTLFNVHKNDTGNKDELKVGNNRDEESEIVIKKEVINQPSTSYTLEESIIVIDSDDEMPLSQMFDDPDIPTDRNDNKEIVDDRLSDEDGYPVILYEDELDDEGVSEALEWFHKLSQQFVEEENDVQSKRPLEKENNKESSFEKTGNEFMCNNKDLKQDVDIVDSKTNDKFLDNRDEVKISSNISDLETDTAGVSSTRGIQEVHQNVKNIPSKQIRLNKRKCSSDVNKKSQTKICVKKLLKEEPLKKADDQSKINITVSKICNDEIKNKGNSESVPHEEYCNENLSLADRLSKAVDHNVKQNASCSSKSEALSHQPSTSSSSNKISEHRINNNFKRNRTISQNDKQIVKDIRKAKLKELTEKKKQSVCSETKGTKPSASTNVKLTKKNRGDFLMDDIVKEPKGTNKSKNSKPTNLLSNYKIPRRSSADQSDDNEKIQVPDKIPRKSSADQSDFDQNQRESNKISQRRSTDQSNDDKHIKELNKISRRRSTDQSNDDKHIKELNQIPRRSSADQSDFDQNQRESNKISQRRSTDQSNDDKHIKELNKISRRRSGDQSDDNKKKFEFLQESNLNEQNSHSVKQTDSVSRTNSTVNSERVCRKKSLPEKNELNQIKYINNDVNKIFHDIKNNKNIILKTSNVNGGKLNANPLNNGDIELIMGDNVNSLVLQNQQFTKNKKRVRFENDVNLVKTRFIEFAEKSMRRPVRKDAVPPQNMKIQHRKENFSQNAFDYFDETIFDICKWNTVWLEEQKKHSTSSPPPVYPGTSFGCKDHYVSYLDYRRTMYPLLLHELWSNISKAWDQRRKEVYTIAITNRFTPPFEYNVKSTKTSSEGQKKTLVLINCQTLLSNEDYKNNSFPRFGDLVVADQITVSYKNSEPRYCSKTVFGYISNATPHRINKHMTGVHPDLMSKSPNAKFIDVMEMIVRGPIPALDSSRLSRIRIVKNITADLRLFRALDNLPQSPLMQPILSPNSNIYISNNTADLPKLVSYENAPVLNDCQKKAVQMTAKMCIEDSNNLHFIHGPPGTGKTQVIVSLILQIWLTICRKHKEYPRILICAPSNAAIDEVVLRLMEIRQTLTDIKKFRLIRNGRVESVHRDVRCLTLGTLASREVKKEIDSYEDAEYRKVEIDNLTAKINSLSLSLDSLKESRDIYTVEEKYLREVVIENKLAEAIERKTNLINHTENKFDQNTIKRMSANKEIQLLERANIIATTLSSCYNTQMEKTFRDKNKQFTCCIIDEATQAQEPETLIPLLLSVRNVVLVGDPQQLPATIMSVFAKQQGLGNSMFTRHRMWWRRNENSWNSENILIHFLNKQYRMHPDIAYWPSKHFYNNMLVTDNRVEFLRQSPLLPYAVLSHEYSQDPQGELNSGEAEMVKNIALTIRNSYGCMDYSIGVITPYKRQQAVLKKDFSCFNNVEVGTVDSFQGRECDVIIFSCVRTDGIGFLIDMQRLNVALTRAKMSLIVVGNFQSLQNDEMWASLLLDAKERSIFKNVPKHMSLANIQNLFDLIRRR